MSALITSHGLPDTICGIESRCITQFLIAFYILLFMVTWHIDSLASILVFSMPILLMWSCSSAYFFSLVGIIITLFFMVILSIMASLSLKVQYCLISWLTSFHVGDQPFIMYLLSFCLSFCRCSYVYVGSCIDMHGGMSVAALMASILSFMPLILLSLFLSCSVSITTLLCMDQDLFAYCAYLVLKY